MRVYEYILDAERPLKRGLSCLAAVKKSEIDRWGAKCAITLPTAINGNMCATSRARLTPVTMQRLSHAHVNTGLGILQLLSCNKETATMADSHESMRRLEKECKSAIQNGFVQLELKTFSAYLE